MLPPFALLLEDRNEAARRMHGTITHWLLIGVAALMGTARLAASAQVGGSTGEEAYVMSAGSAISWEAPWALHQGVPLGDGAGLVLIANDDALVSNITETGAAEAEPVPTTSSSSFVAAGADPDTIVSTDGGESVATANSLEIGIPMGMPYGAFALARGDGGEGSSLTVLYAPVHEFSESMASAQARIAIDEEPVFPGVGGDGLQALLESVATELPGAGSGGVANEDERPAGALDLSKRDGDETAEPVDGVWTDPL